MAVTSQSGVPHKARQNIKTQALFLSINDIDQRVLWVRQFPAFYWNAKNHFRVLSPQTLRQPRRYFHATPSSARWRRSPPWRHRTDKKRLPERQRGATRVYLWHCSFTADFERKTEILGLGRHHGVLRRPQPSPARRSRGWLRGKVVLRGPEPP